MALQECGLNLSRGGRELQPHGTPEFPCAGYAARYVRRQEDLIPWHWHEELELLYVEEGCMEVQVASERSLICEGGLFAVNSNMLHSAMAADACTLHSLVFSAALLTGDERSVFARKYIGPLLRCPAFTGCPVEPLGPGEPARDFYRAFQAMEQERAGFEFIVRDSLSRIALALVEQFRGQLSLPAGAQSQDNVRMRAMLEHIHRNYADELTLADIAGAAGIGERECLRCFQKTIQSSPIQYLLKYRIMQGAQRLLCCPEESIAELALACGFSSQSNFSKLFKRFYRCTPREYRAAGGGPLSEDF